MLRYRIVPADPAFAPVELTATSAAGALNTISRLGCEQADVYADARYAFTARIDDSGVWSISSQPKVVEVPRALSPDKSQHG